MTHRTESSCSDFARVFLEVRAREPHDLLAALVVIVSRRRPARRDLVLRNLVALGQVGVEVVLAREHAAPC